MAGATCYYIHRFKGGSYLAVVGGGVVNVVGSLFVPNLVSCCGVPCLAGVCLTSWERGICDPIPRIQVSDYLFAIHRWKRCSSCNEKRYIRPGRDCLSCTVINVVGLPGDSTDVTENFFVSWPTSLACSAVSLFLVMLFNLTCFGVLLTLFGC